jgi:hypothetical protein
LASTASNRPQKEHERLPATVELTQGTNPGKSKAKAIRCRVSLLALVGCR